MVSEEDRQGVEDRAEVGKCTDISEWKKEGSHSGLVRTLGKRMWGNPPRVRISYPPQYIEDLLKSSNI